ncbi:MAG: methionyl-tRNA formyltransferase, partial [Patescibacteria group bacterium]
MNYVFFGTPEFAIIILKTLIEAGLMPALVVTAPDKPQGRGNMLTPPPVKTLAEDYGISFAQPATLKNNDDLVSTITKIHPDLFVVAAYGKIIPKILLDIPRKGAINVHPSLLPQYRGPSPIQAA